jgi:hypothetical protein
MNVNQHKDASFSRRNSERDDRIEFSGMSAKENDKLSDPAFSGISRLHWRTETNPSRKLDEAEQR